MKVQLGSNNTPLPTPLELDATRSGKGEQARNTSVSNDQAALVSTGGVDAQLLGAYQPYIQQAAAASEINTSAVAEARKAVEDGTLDTSETIGRLAERLLAEGI